LQFNRSTSARRSFDVPYHHHLSVDEPQNFTVRYRLTEADARDAFWFAARDWIPALVGLALLTLVCATWSPLTSPPPGAR
jgi:hypothetical protein